MPVKTVCGLDVRKDSDFLCVMHENGEKILENCTNLNGHLKNGDKFLQYELFCKNETKRRKIMVGTYR